MATAAVDLDTLKRHVGRTQTAVDVLHAGPANLLRLLGRAEPELRDGDPLPPAWLALYFLPRVPTAELRPDGSPRDTGVIPPMPLPRRMFAGERVRFQRSLVIGESLKREMTLADLSVKTGGTGTLVFVTVTSRVIGADGIAAVEDERRTVFRDEVKAGERNQAPRRESAPNDVSWRRRVTPEGTIAMSCGSSWAGLSRVASVRPGGDAVCSWNLVIQDSVSVALPVPPPRRWRRPHWELDYFRAPRHATRALISPVSTTFTGTLSTCAGMEARRRWLPCST